MKILWISHFVPYPPAGGMLLRSFNLIRELAKTAELHLFSLVQPRPLKTRYGDLEAALEDARENLGRYCSEVEFFSVPAEERRFGRHRIALRALIGGRPYSAMWLESPPLLDAVRQAVKYGAYDLVHVDTVGLDAVRQVITDVPMTLTHHNIESEMMLRRARVAANPLARSYFGLEARRLARMERSVEASYAKHLVCSELDSDRLRQIAPGANTAVVPNGVDIDFFQPDPDADQINDVIFVGGLGWYPNHSAMVWFLRDIWPALLAKEPDLKFDLVGAEPSQQIKALAANAGGVRVLGFVPDVRPYMSGSRIFVCPIFEGGGTKLKILDAFAMGMPVVAHPTAMEGIPAIEGRDYLQASTPEEFTEKVLRLRANAKERVDLARNARRFVERNFAWPRIGTALAELYESISAAEDVSRATSPLHARGAEL